MDANRVICVLIVDDDDVDRDLARRMLTRSSLKSCVMEAENGADAIGILKSNPVDCVLLDQRLSDTTGAIWLARIRKESLFHGPVIMVTGAGSEDLAVEAMKAGAAGYVSKMHLDGARLTDAILQSLERYEAEVAHRMAEADLARRVVEQDQHLRHYDRTLQDILDHSSNLIAYWDAGGRIQFGNRMHEDWFGVQPDVLPGLSPKELLGEALYEVYRPYMERALAGLTQRFEHPFHRPHDDINEMVLQVDFRPDVSESGEVAGFYVTMSDMTALVNARNQAQESSRLKSAFLANMSHEIRTPMNAIIGLTELALVRPSHEQSQRYLGQVHEAALALMGILDDILDHSRLEAGQLKIDPVTVRIDDLLERAVELFSGKLQQKRLRFSVNVDEAVPLAVKADPLRLAQIINNLLGNAVKFTQAGGIELRVSATHADAGARLRIAVQDSGIGIDQEKQRALFDAFVQADASITRRFGGTGLGLSICQRLVEAMSGEMGVCSTLGQGSTFWFELPLQLELDETLSAGGSAAHRINGHTLALFDKGRVPGIYAREMALNTSRWVVSDDVAKLCSWMDGLDWSSTQTCRIIIDGSNRTTAEVLDAAMTLGQHVEQLTARTPSVLVLTAAWGRDELERCLNATLGAQVDVLIAPVLPKALLKAIKQLDCLVAPSLTLSPIKPAMPPTTAGLTGLRVLLAEDNPMNQLVAQSMLEQAGVSVTVCSDGLQAIQMVDQCGVEAFDVILLDVHMPVMDGLETTRQLQAKYAQQVPIIAMTAAVMPEDRSRCEEAGMVDVVAKPIMVHHLYDTLRRWATVPSA